MMKIFKGVTIKAKLLITLLTLSFLCLSISLSISYYVSYNAVMTEAKSRFITLSEKYAENINGWLKEKGTIVQQLSDDITLQNNYDKIYLSKWLTEIQKKNPETVDVYLGLENKIVVSGVGWVPDADYDCTKRDWYTQAVSAKKLVYTTPYLDVGSKKMVITIATPIYKNNNISGVIALDIPIDNLTNMISTTKVGKNDYGFLIDNENNIMVHPNKEFQPTEKESKKIDSILNGSLKSIISNANKSNILSTTDYDKQEKYFAYAPINTANWIIGFSVPIDELKEPLNNLFTGFIIALALSIILCAIIGPIIVSSIIKPLKNMMKLMEIASKGDLTIRSDYDKKDEIGQLSTAFNNMIDGTKTLIKKTEESIIQISEATENLASTCEENFSAIDEVSKTVVATTEDANVQAETSKQTVSITESLSEGIQNIHVSVDNSIGYSKEMLEQSNKGLKVVDILEAKTDDNNKVIKQVVDVVTNLNNKIIRVQDILENINAISEQTNLLALNAAIEAARAGEAGKGFAVVAEEVRKLSENTQTSNNDVKTILCSINEDVTKAQEIMNMTNEVVKEQNNAVAHTKDTFNNIVKGVEAIVDKINSINSNVENIIAHKNNVVDSIKNISAISENTSASLEEIAAITEQQTAAVEQTSNLSVTLSEMTKELQETIRVFKV